MHKLKLSETDICTKRITPAIIRAGWDVETQIRQEVTFTKGRVIVRGRMVLRGKSKRADYILSYKPDRPLAVIEAKDASHSVGAGMQQALEYAEMLDVPFVFSSNGDGFLFHDRTGQSSPAEREISLDELPGPEDLWRRYCAWKRIPREREALVTQDYFSEPGGKEPRYFQTTSPRSST